MQQALDALKIAEVDGNCYYEATDLLRKRLAQPEQEPLNNNKVKQLVSKCTHRDADGNWYVDGVQLVHETCFALDAIKRKSATPPAAQRKQLTQAQIESGRRASWGFNSDYFTAGVRFAEAAHGIKGDR
jgi:hypothetical protein